MDKSYVVVIGNGTTSRANLEALIEDYFYAKGKEVSLVLAFNNAPSQGQIFAAQYAKDKGKDIIVFCKEGANLQSMPSASISEVVAPSNEAIDLPDSVVMLLWDATDPECGAAMEYCESRHKRSYNLCEGLSLLTRETAKADAKAEIAKVVVEEVKQMAVSAAPTAEITKEVLRTIIAALQDALKKA